MASILFMPTFFSSYRSGCNENEEDDADDDDEDEDRDEIRERGTCKLSMKVENILPSISVNIFASKLPLCHRSQNVV
jgi:hypothetical protein